ncbi:MAG TPA: class I SAM-dependent methyltransferase [Actinophytocola sp.]|jgi:ubiquinone/menaquinone biosynthesis C-methylase UbiE|uniref:class I SAM-dependent methyltransferase n=1 Tax=Actinophytocola sp. TaxID=1872138 RepID=UPI002F932235
MTSVLPRVLPARAIRSMVRQFGHPRGLPGRLVGWIMAHRRSNVARNRWVVAVLDVRPTERVLEIGFGPGIALAELARRVTRGQVYGVDHSAVMVAQASRRNAAAIAAHRVRLTQAPVDRLPSFTEPLDTVFAVNNMAFWPDPQARLRELRGLLRPGGRIALVSQPRSPGANRETTKRVAQELQDALTRAGFTWQRTETLALDPPVACVIATNTATNPAPQ